MHRSNQTTKRQGAKIGGTGMAKAKKGLIELSDVNRELQKVVSSGKMLIGSKETIKALRRKEAKIVIHASNCPEEIKRVFNDKKENGEITIYEYPANSLELGLACGKPYAIASLCITETGASEILRILAPNVLPKGRILDINVSKRKAQVIRTDYKAGH